jgi:hypothetical protein
VRTKKKKNSDTRNGAGSIADQRNDDIRNKIESNIFFYVKKCLHVKKVENGRSQFEQIYTTQVRECVITYSFEGIIRKENRGGYKYLHVPVFRRRCVIREYVPHGVGVSTL